MVTIHNLGFPRIGANRELKKSLESYWNKKISLVDLQKTGKEIRINNLHIQQDLDLAVVNDFSYYDQVLDTSVLLGNIPKKYRDLADDHEAVYFAMARGANDSTGKTCHALEMTKWFDTNYHFMVPEFTAETTFTPNTAKLLGEIEEAKEKGYTVKPVLVGPLTYLYLGKCKDNTDKFSLLSTLTKAYKQILSTLANAGIEWVQIDEPILVTDIEQPWKDAFISTYKELTETGVKLLLATYFGELRDNLELALSLPVAGLHVDAVRNRSEVEPVIKNLGENKVLSLGVIDGRNIWKSNLSELLNFITPIYEHLGDRLWLAPSCSLLHVPVTLDSEDQLDPEIKNWLAFAVQKIEELTILRSAINTGPDSVKVELEQNAAALKSRAESVKTHNTAVREKLAHVDETFEKRQSPYKTRAQVQKEILQLPLYPTTTIGSFPQTEEIRKTRLLYKKKEISNTAYEQAMLVEIANTVRIQEELKLDVLVHGEAERNDMVEYFGEHLDGYIFTRFGWVQSYGSRCVKPPVIVGDISRPVPITLDWISYAQSVTDKPMKGMLTGPVTILNWSFVRDDQPRSETCRQIALALRDEVQDLEKAGIKIIQIDEAALREGLPLRKSEWQEYLDWAISSFKITANGVKDETQIHTHMCYSDFNDIIEAIASMDADVITIETSRSQMELLDVFDTFNYPNEIGPGVYDIHSPNIPTVEAIVSLMKLASTKIPAERLWVNPDCGLKTRRWHEVKPALTNMVQAAELLRKG